MPLSLGMQFFNLNRSFPRSNQPRFGVDPEFVNLLSFVTSTLILQHTNVCCNFLCSPFLSFQYFVCRFLKNKKSQVFSIIFFDIRTLGVPHFFEFLCDNFHQYEINRFTFYAFDSLNNLLFLYYVRLIN